ncbi:MAG: rhamnopyranosyl-N-acetylglucosaminyl-diphospho-decaprenol beta,3/1,4-galactofuranosyltransferase, partial [Solirubrobacteraceae bacterium]|nr:rhamnopyranosyl-N-acetylglucosaminyl-diphospho-decaprenol beta,3/1,4-galactofuranosyltransferase [Solirubrobacteraceae bacterium]
MPDSVQAVVVTYNRRALLLECLEGIARQTHPVAGVLVVDNASTDGTREALERSGVADRLRIDYLRLARNGGGSEGFHYGVREALRPGAADWL